jgi:hypothetical protein
MKQSDLQPLLAEFAAERLSLIQRHEAAAMLVAHYDFNNTYQYVINREETHLKWVQDALAEFGAPAPPASRELPVPAVRTGKKVLDDDVKLLGSFVDRWKPRIADMSHARHRIMLNVVIGESLEHKRLFEQASGGFEDLLGRRTGGVARQGGVLPTRWQE